MAMKNKVLLEGFIVFFTLSLLLFGCKKILKVDLPVGRHTTETVFKDKATAVTVMNGIYGSISSSSIFSGISGLTFASSLKADELRPDNPVQYSDYSNLANGSGLGWAMWRTYGEQIYHLNSIIEGISKSGTLSDQTKSILTAEAKFTRAWIYFYLVNFYGDVPLVLTTDFRENSTIPRSSVAEVYQQIVLDLKEAQANLADNYVERDLVSPSMDRIRPNKAAATALLARIFLYTSNWIEAELEATKLINSSSFQLLEDLDQVFLKNSRETIWALQPNILDGDGVNPKDGMTFISPYGGTPLFNISSFLLGSFETGDRRKEQWVANLQGHIVPFKYKERWRSTEQKEFYVVLRLAEQYLIRAEARAHLNKLSGPESAASDLNVIRQRAGLLPTNAATDTQLLAAILEERRAELFTEWGHRWLDLVRTKNIDKVMSVVAPIKGGAWQPYKALLPIPYSEFELNPALRGHQNPGYLEHP
jgi:starch-binding outer membrane protein, SusD/RagB family